MKGTICFDHSKAVPFTAPEEWGQLEAAVRHAHFMLHEKTGLGHEYLGWVDLPVTYDETELVRMKQAATRISQQSDVLLVIGIGGSYLGARAVLDSLGHTFYNVLGKSKRQTPEIYFVGNNISSVYMSHLMDVLEEKNVSRLMSSPNQGRRQSLRSPFVFSASCWKKRWEKTRRGSVFTLPPTETEER
ncbi:UNVERIFIED_CONTAM: glucose-6-phosphate isomerase [Brevibacillus sp. OAP136]